MLIKINTSFVLIWPKSPWEQELASTKKDGVPTEAKVEAIFFAIIPDFPTPDKITFPFLQSNILSTVFLKLLSKEYFNLFKETI